MVYISAVLQQPLHASAVWTDNEQAFYVCWEWPYIQSAHPVAFSILDAHYSTFNYFPCSNRSYCISLRRPPTTEDTVFVQTTSSTALPSDPLPVCISGMRDSITIN